MQDYDNLAFKANFGTEEERREAFLKLWALAQEAGIKPASINDLYMARGKGEVPLDFSVPAINVRGMPFEMAKSIFKVAVKENVGAVIFEIARSEIGYTKQPPREFTATMLAAALNEGFTGPLFIQADHFQTKVSETPGVPKEGEVEKVKQLIKDAIEAGFYNIDIDLSTLVDYAQPNVKEEQKTNYTLSAEISEYVRELEPEGITISLGGEIGHIGGKNSTEEELHAYMEGYRECLKPGLVGLSKVAIQTGTHHGGVPLADGTLADVSVDFGTLKKLARVAREYGMSGTVQHGASTLPDEYFSQFVKCEAVEVHLATGFQNLILDHPQFPKDLLQKMYNWVDSDLTDERKEKWTDEQFHYKLRKKALGQFKQEIWELPEEIRLAIRADLEKRFLFMFTELNVLNTKELVNKFVTSVSIEKK